MIKERIYFKESNLIICTDEKKYVNAAFSELLKQRAELEKYIKKNPKFKYSFKPIKVKKNAPRIVKIMATAAKLANVGPMAAVAGAIADLVAEAIISAGAKNAIVENGGDIIIINERPVTIGIFAGDSPFSGKIGFKIQKGHLGICTSSGTVSRSISLGKADAAIAVAKTAAIADAAATAIGNATIGEGKKAVDSALKLVKKLKIMGALIIKGEHMGSFGKLPKIVRCDFRINNIIFR